MTIPLPELSPAHLAAIFWAMDAEQQGKFFDELGTLVMITPAPYSREIGSLFGLDLQLHAASQRCTALGQDVMSRFTDYGTRYLKPLHADTERMIAGHFERLTA